MDTPKTKTFSNKYPLTKQEMKDLVGFGVFSMDSKQGVKQLQGKKSMLKSFTLDSGNVVSSVVKMSCGDKTQIGRISHFLTVHDQLSGKESEGEH